jgi:4-diphosphocytidyl-2-C-methyl-D-erythritol kinase
MVVFPKAKINLGLMITGKRPDGYHDLESIFYPVSLCDALEVVAGDEAAESDILTLSGNNLQGNPEENLVIKAVKRLREKNSFPFLKIHLHKAIPAGSGLGGGSSDAASIIITVNRIFKLSLPPAEMRSIASGLGSDSPFFIESRPALATGRGEILHPLKSFFNGYHILIVNPGITISTREAYEECEPSTPAAHLSEMIARPVTEWRELIINDFEKTIFRKYPEIKSFKKTLYSNGAFYSSMSGSGSGVYGIFKEKPVVPDDLRKYVIYSGML